MVDRDPLPSDQVLSTHTIHPPGFALLEDLGVGDAVLELAPPTHTARLRKNDSWADVSFDEGRIEICPRRERLDGLLVDAAVTAGADLRDRTRATRVVFDEGRAVGVELERDGRRETVRADVVIGADGRRSLVASQVGAEEYMAYDAPRAMYWAYWDAPDAWYSDDRTFDMYLAHVGPDIRVIFQTDNDQLLIGTLPPTDVAKSWRDRDVEAFFLQDLAHDDVIEPLLDGARPESSVRGTLKERYYFRRAAGDGWALVGDAGHHKEFVAGDGITEALIQAKDLAAAISDGGPGALRRWWRERDVKALPGYFWGRDEGALGSPAELEQIVLARAAERDALKKMLTQLPEHQSSPYDVFPPKVILPCLLGALLRGRFGVIPEFFAQGRRLGEYKRALRARERLLQEELAA